MPHAKHKSWMTPAVLGIAFATFFSDVGHEMVTAALPIYLGSVGLGAAALGAMEGLADLMFSLSKLLGGWVGHRSSRKRLWGSAGYLLTAVGTSAMALTQGLLALVSLRAAAWFGRGFRSPLRDFLLADEVGPTHFGRAYGLERAADMLGAVAGPLLAASFLWSGLEVRTILLFSIVPSFLAVAFFFSSTRDAPPSPSATATAASRVLPRRFWLFCVGVGLFGLGDFSRTFLIFTAARVFGEGGQIAPGSLSIAMLLYAAHNLMSALAAYPAGYLGDRRSKLGVLIAGYALGCLTNGLFAFASTSPALLVLAILLSGIYIAVEETLEKAAAVDMLEREQRSLGLGILAAANAAGDMLSSVLVGLLLHAGYLRLAFAIPAGFGLLGTAWMLFMRRRLR